MGVEDPRWVQRMSGTAAVLWSAAALLAALTPVTDKDLGFHIAWGRILLSDFRGARTLLLGQDPSVTVYAYAYWLYQVTVVALYDHAGAWALVAFRLSQVVAMFALAGLLARRLGAASWAVTATFALGIVMAYERFVDRPDVLSHVAWMGALWILVFHRRDRGVWTLVPLTVLWVNTHHHFTLLLAAYVAFAVGDALDGEWVRGQIRRYWRRSGLVLGALLLATLVNPAGPAAWMSQVKLAGVITRHMAPVPITEVLGSYAAYKPYPALWVFRFALPVCLVLAVFTRKRIGTGAVLVLLLSAVLAILARRAVSLFAVTAVAFMPAVLDARFAALPARVRRSIPLGISALALVTGLAAVIGLANGRIFLAQDREGRVGDIGSIHFPTLGAARFLRSSGIEGPIFHSPTQAGPILLENGIRLTPFSDTRWCGTREENDVFVKLSSATDASVAAIWNSIQGRHHFETVLLDFYGLPALLRHLVSDPEWALVYLDDGGAVFCRRGGRNAGTIAGWEGRVAAQRATLEPDAERKLAALAAGFLRSAEPSVLASLRFPWPDFHRANFAMQIRSRPEATAAYLDLYRNEGGSLHSSTHRTDILGNTLWCLAESREWEAREAICSALADQEKDPARRRTMSLGKAQALLQLGRGREAEAIALRVAVDPAAGSEERFWAWSCVAGSREEQLDHTGAADALRHAEGFRSRTR